MKTPEEKREYGRRYREAQGEMYKIKQHIRNLENRKARLQWNRDHVEHRKQWVEDNREKVREDQLKWRKKNPSYHHDYYQQNKEKISAYMKKYNQKRKLKK